MYQHLLLGPHAGYDCSVKSVIAELYLGRKPPSLEIPAELLSEVRKYGIMAKWDLRQVDTQKLIILFKNLSQISQ